MSKAEFIEKYKSLQKNETTFLKDTFYFISKKDDKNSAFKCKLEETFAIFEKEVNEEQQKFYSNLQSTNHSITVFKNELQKPRPDMVQHVKQMMHSIEMQLMDIKSYQKSVYDELIASETSLSAELTIFNNDIHRYEKVIKYPLHYANVKSRTQTSNQHHVHPAVIEFDKFCSINGQSNHWGEYEHQLFLKNYNKNTSDEEMLQKLTAVLPFKTLLQIKNQISWYRKYELLEKAKRDALKEWRKTKKAKAHKTNNQDVDAHFEKLQKKKKQLYEKERQEKLAQVNAYKVQKELQRVIAEEEALNARIAESDKEVKRQEYIIKQKEKATAFKEKKQVELELKEAAEQEKLMENKAQSSVTSSVLLSLHEKNMKIVEKKQQQKQEKIIADFELQQKLEKLKPTIIAKRDPSRLLQKTQGQINREKDTSSNVNPVTGSRSMPHRALPSWRKGL